MTNKWILLDIDGVLHGEHTMFHPDNMDIDPAIRQDPDALRAAWTLEPSAIGMIRWIAQQTKAQVVISSNWRYSHGAERTVNKLQEAGLPNAIMATPPTLPCTGSRTRPTKEQDIQAWIHAMGDTMPPDSCVILDDEYFYTPSIQAHHLHINPTTGIQPMHARIAAIALGATSLLPVDISVYTRLLDIAGHDRIAALTFLHADRRYTAFTQDPASILLGHADDTPQRIEQFWAEAMARFAPPARTSPIYDNF